MIIWVSLAILIERMFSCLHLSLLSSCPVSLSCQQRHRWTRIAPFAQLLPWSLDFFWLASQLPTRVCAISLSSHRHEITRPNERSLSFFFVHRRNKIKDHKKQQGKVVWFEFSLGMPVQVCAGGCLQFTLNQRSRCFTESSKVQNYHEEN